MAATSRTATDKELELYRSIMEEPTEYRDGFTWTTVLGALFCGLLMYPGAIYLSLINGGRLGAASWVTLIIFSEISRRALKTMSRQEVVVLLFVANTMMAATGGIFGGFVYKAYLVRSDPVLAAGLAGQFPKWYVPAADSRAILERTFLDKAWILPVSILVFTSFLSIIKKYTLGYAMFRITSDFEHLPFPFAPISAQGSMAIAEAGDKKNAWKWRAFSTGTMIGLLFGLFYIGLPVITGAFLAKPMMLFPLPWYDTTTLTEKILPAVPTGIVWRLGLVITGMIIPWRAVQGTALALLVTFILNPILVKTGILTTWQPGMGTVDTQISNNIDFYFSFGIGCALGIALVSIGQTIKALKKSFAESRKRRRELFGDKAVNPWAPPPGRGDWSLKIAFIGYFLAAAALIILCKILVPDFPLIFLIFFGFLYTPLISYLNARLIAVNGQHVEIPFIREGAILLSGTRGLDVWLAPFPKENFGGVAGSMRVTELTGTKLTSLIKIDMLRFPLSILLGFIFWGFIWHSTPIPSETFPFTQIMWDLRVKNWLIMVSATTGDGLTETMFDKAFKPEIIGIGAMTTTAMFLLLRSFGAPIMFVYGFVRGIGTHCHPFVLEIVGALIARFYLHKKYGRQRILRIMPVVMAGYMVGEGLVGMACVAITLIAKAISGLPL